MDSPVEASGLWRLQSCKIPSVTEHITNPASTSEPSLQEEMQVLGTPQVIHKIELELN